MAAAARLFRPLRMGVGRRELLVGSSGVALAALVASPRAQAEDVPVPVPLQIKLLVKVAGYDRNLRTRAGDKVRVLLSHRSSHAEAERVATLAKVSLEGHPTIGDLPVEVVTAVFASPAELARAIAKLRIAVVYVCPGHDRAVVESIARALDGADVLTAAAAPADVPGGVVLGFELVSGKPKLVVNLAQARKQKVALPAEVLKLAKVIS